MSFQEDFPEAFEICKQFELNNDQMKEIILRMTYEIRMGLKKDTHPRAVIKCFVTYVQDLPTGEESGKYLALDLGGTNFRVLLITVAGENQIEIEFDSFVISKDLMTGPGKDLFDFVAKCLSEFVIARCLQDEELPLGFTFSFPVQQMGLTRGKLMGWTKGFNCSGVVGENVVDLLQQAMARRGDVKIKVVAILNDTTGTLMTCAFHNHKCRIGLIVGTGTNACYVEKTSNTECYEHYKTSNKPNMIVNCEWGAFGDNGVLSFVLTKYDKLVDKSTPNVGKQTFEKCISGMYLGELVRLIVVDLMQQGHMFAQKDSQQMKTKWSFLTKFISNIESDEPGTYHHCDEVLEELGLRGATESDKKCLRFICETISRRSAKLCSCGLVCLIKQMGVTDVAIGIDGGVYKSHPKYHNMLVENMTKLLPSNIQFELVLSVDGSGVGAGLIAAIADYQSKKTDDNNN